MDGGTQWRPLFRSLLTAPRVLAPCAAAELSRYVASIEEPILVVRTPTAYRWLFVMHGIGASSVFLLGSFLQLIVAVVEGKGTAERTRANRIRDEDNEYQKLTSNRDHRCGGIGS